MLRKWMATTVGLLTVIDLDPKSWSVRLPKFLFLSRQNCLRGSTLYSQLVSYRVRNLLTRYH